MPCTELSPSDEELPDICEKRWDIEVCFNRAKHYLKLDSGIQVPDFEAIAAHSAIVMVRYIFMAIEEQLAVDQRTIQTLFHVASEEHRDIVITEVSVRALSTAGNKARDLHAMSEQIPE